MLAELAHHRQEECAEQERAEQERAGVDHGNLTGKTSLSQPRYPLKSDSTTCM